MFEQMDMFQTRYTDPKIITDGDVLNAIVPLLDDNFASSGSVSVRINKSKINSIVYTAKPTVYQENVGEQLICRVKTGGKPDKRYVSFPGYYRVRLTDLELSFSEIKSDPFLRIAICDFMNFCKERASDAAELIKEILANAYRFELFDCCSRYIECSRAKKCIHPDKIYSSACSYRKNLERGKIFY